MYCHAAESTYQGTILASHDRLAISDVTHLEIKLLVDSFTMWDNSLAAKEINIVLTSDFDTGTCYGWVTRVCRCML